MPSCFCRDGQTILTVHDLVSVARLTGVRRAIFVMMWYRMPVWRAGTVTVVSQWTSDQLVALLPRALPKIRVIHNPVPRGLATTPLRPAPRPVVLQVGTGANKNLDRVAEALSGLDVHLRIVGHLNEEQLGRLAVAAVEFSHTSEVTDAAMASEYEACHIVMFVSTYEGFGLPILEAQASGRPVITSAAASMPEVAGEGALIVDPLMVAEIREAVRTLMGMLPFATRSSRRDWRTSESMTQR